MSRYSSWVSRQIVVLVMASAALAGCQTTATKLAQGSPEDREAGTNADKLRPLSASSGVGGRNVDTTLSSGSILLPDYVPVRRYQDVFTLDGENKRVLVEYAWDYRAGTAVEKVYDESGLELRRTQLPGTTISFTDRELELAIALTREDPRLAGLFKQGDMNYYAGFAYREPDDPGCGEGSRCLHVIVSEGDGQRHVAHSIVDLMTRRVIHPQLDPDRFPDLIPGKS
ncbi:hypothetical protein [Dokdonella sp.]|uniref:hypothetical protein n=1 Tax=Dokdonella sp. TaxID=2291710 RepID=UPI0035274BDF